MLCILVLAVIPTPTVQDLCSKYAQLGFRASHRWRTSPVRKQPRFPAYSSRLGSNCMSLTQTCWNTRTKTKVDRAVQYWCIYLTAGRTIVHWSTPGPSWSRYWGHLLTLADELTGNWHPLNNMHKLPTSCSLLQYTSSRVIVPPAIDHLITGLCDDELSQQMWSEFSLQTVIHVQMM